MHASAPNGGGHRVEGPRGPERPALGDGERRQHDQVRERARAAARGGGQTRPRRQCAPTRHPREQRPSARMVGRGGRKLQLQRAERAAAGHAVGDDRDAVQAGRLGPHLGRDSGRRGRRSACAGRVTQRFADLALEQADDARLRRRSVPETANARARLRAPLVRGERQARDDPDRDRRRLQPRPRRRRPRRPRGPGRWPGSTTLVAQLPSGPDVVAVDLRPRPSRRAVYSIAQRRAGGRGAVGEAQRAGDADRRARPSGSTRPDRDRGDRDRVAGGAGPQIRQLGVQRVAGAGRLVAVAVAADALEDDRRAARVAVALAAAGDQRDLALHGHGVQATASSRSAARATPSRARRAGAS